MQQTAAMSGLDYKFAVEELRALEGGFLSNAYDEGESGGKFRIKFNANGERNVRVELGKRIHLTSIIPKAPKDQSSFTKEIRKHFDNARVVKVEQLGAMDRIVKFAFTNKMAIVFESFAKGNAFIIDENGAILRPMTKDASGRGLMKGKPYAPPEGKKSFEHAKAEDLTTAGTNAFDAITKAFGIAPAYAREALARAKVNADGEPDGDDAIAIAAALQSLCTQFKPTMYELGKEQKMFSPIELVSISPKAATGFPSFWECLDAYYSIIPRSATSKKNPITVKFEKIDASIKQLDAGKIAIENESKAESAKGDWVYSHYNEVATALEYAKAGDEKNAIKAIETTGAQARFEKGKLVVSVDDKVD